VLDQFRLAALFIALAPAGSALAQASSGTASFCEAVGAYMQDVSAQRAAGVELDAAIDEVALAFDAMASDADDLANRRRVLQASRPLAVFAYGLVDLEPETVEQIGVAHCAARGGDVQLAPAPTVTAAIAAEAGKCERRGTVDAACIAKATGAQASATTSVAQRTERSPRNSSIQPFYELGLAAGGDTVGSIVFVNGGQQAIEAGDGASFGGGVVQRIDDRFGIKYTVSYKVSFSAASNADVMKTVLPIDVVPYYRSGDHKVGVGLSLHLSPKVDWDWLAPEQEFDDATGLTLEYAFRRFSFSYTDIDYETDTQTFDASHLGFKFTSKF
jgi:hypothetical protein